MSPEKKGLNIIFEPVEKKVQLDQETKEKISGKLEGFLEKENLWENITPEMSYIMASYSGGRFAGGPGFFINPEDDPEENGWELRITSGPINYMEFALDKENKEVEITELTFKENGYSPKIVNEWVDGVLNGIQTAKDRKSFEWKIK